MFHDTILASDGRYRVLYVCACIYTCIEIAVGGVSFGGDKIRWEIH